MDYTPVSADEFDQADGVGDWRFVLGAIRGTFAAGSFPAASTLVAAITDVAERLAHHPDIDIRYPGDLHLVVATHATGGLTTLDLDLAREISELARLAGAVAKPAAGQMTEICIDALDIDQIRPFWAAVLDYCIVDDGSIVDPRRQGPPLWFQQMDEPRSQRNRIHFDVSVPHDIAQQRIATALAAGGVMVSDDRAKAFWILADAEGNEACICTWQDR